MADPKVDAEENRVGFHNVTAGGVVLQLVLGLGLAVVAGMCAG